MASNSNDRIEDYHVTLHENKEHLLLKKLKHLQSYSLLRFCRRKKKKTVAHRIPQFLFLAAVNIEVLKNTKVLQVLLQNCTARIRIYT
jgi:hypothetical protein